MVKHHSPLENKHKPILFLPYELKQGRKVFVFNLKNLLSKRMDIDFPSFSHSFLMESCQQYLTLRIEAEMNSITLD